MRVGLLVYGGFSFWRGLSSFPKRFSFYEWTFPVGGLRFGVAIPSKGDYSFRSASLVGKTYLLGSTFLLGVLPFCVDFPFRADFLFGGLGF